MTAPTPAAPPCPNWCRACHPAGGWTVEDRDRHKRCERFIVVDTVMDYTLEQFAEVDERGRVTVDGPYLRFMGIQIPLDSAVNCAYAVIELAGMAGLVAAA